MRTFIAVWAILIAPHFAYAYMKIPPGFITIAHRCHVPAEVLYSVALTETSTKMIDGSHSPWHNAINWQGHSYYFKTKKGMYNFANNLLEKGYRSFDVGIMQLNWRWQKHRGYSLWDLMDIGTNVSVACEILKEGYAKKRSWVEAAGYYHNPSSRAYRYERTFEKNLARLS